MIICQTPLRVSFFGGGTDFPEFFQKHGGAVLTTAIDKHIYHSITHFHSSLFDYSIRLAYSRVECVRRLEDIQHAPFREILRYFNVARDVEVSLAADLPALSGLGSSSSFTVGMINALSAYQGEFLSKDKLASLAIHIERDILKESVGFQDQIAAAFGGISVIEFASPDKFAVTRVPISREKLDELEASLMLFFTGIRRRAGDIEKNKSIGGSSSTQETLKRMLSLVEKAHKTLTGNEPLSQFGRLLDATWKQKRSLDRSVSNDVIDDMYASGRKAGAIGGKLLGAGGGGFMLFFVPPERRAKVRRALKGYAEVPFRIDAMGSRIIHS